MIKFLEQPSGPSKDEVQVPVGGLVWATSVPAWTETEAQASAGFGHIQSHILWETPPV